uniref:E74 like ETS transcription factor 3 n=1 Tax=Podarcis muralis TaxID=64176 RepID=A0A670I0L2_PODMU
MHCCSWLHTVRYSNEVVAPLLSFPPHLSAGKPTWYGEMPHCWSRAQVLEWISYHVEKNKYDASAIDFSCCNMDGYTLCQYTRDQLGLIFGPLGDELYDRLHEIRLQSRVTGPTLGPFHTSHTMFTNGKLLQWLYPHARKISAWIHLWEFIRDILIHPEMNEGLLKWEDRREGIFKFLRSEAVAQLWGQKKKNSSMTYEKLSRAMRYYYKREILERVDGRRLVYKFGKNSSGWKEEEVQDRS